MPMPLFFTEINRTPPASRRTETCVACASSALSTSARTTETGRSTTSPAEARAVGYGAVGTVARALGLTRPTITAGMKELGEARELTLFAPKDRIQPEGAGRPRATDVEVRLRPALEELVEPSTRGHPMSPLRWTCKSARTTAAELMHQGHAVSHQTVSDVPQQLGYRLQANRKARERTGHRDRNEQFEHIARHAKAFQQRGQPVISVDTKKKDLVGDFNNAGRQWYPKANDLPGGCMTLRTRSWAKRFQRCARLGRQRGRGQCWD